MFYTQWRTVLQDKPLCLTRNYLKDIDGFLLEVNIRLIIKLLVKRGQNSEQCAEKRNDFVITLVFRKLSTVYLSLTVIRTFVVVLLVRNKLQKETHQFHSRRVYCWKSDNFKNNRKKMYIHTKNKTALTQSVLLKIPWVSL